MVWNRIASKKAFGLISKNVFISDSMHFITGNNLKYISAILNSKLLQFIISIIIGAAVGGNAGNAENVANLPIPALDTPEKQEIASEIEYAVDQILELKAEDPKADIFDQEQRIDKLVFELYDLSELEKNIVV
jgi:hypothetical protein